MNDYVYISFMIKSVTFRSSRNFNCHFITPNRNTNHITYDTNIIQTWYGNEFN